MPFIMIVYACIKPPDILRPEYIPRQADEPPYLEIAVCALPPVQA